MRKFIFALCLLQASYISAQNIVEKFDIATGGGRSNPSSFTEYNGRLYFYATDINDNQQIWSTEGSTHPIRSIIIGDSIGAHRNIHPLLPVHRNMAVLNNNLYFVADGNNNYTYRIYSYNGIKTTAVTDTSVTNIGHPYLLLAFNQKIYFAAHGSKGHQLYSYNPINNSTTRHTTLPDPNNFILDFFVYKNKIIILTKTHISSASDKGIWEYNPLNNTTREIPASSSYNMYNYHAEHDGLLYIGEGYPKSGGGIYTYSGNGNLVQLSRMTIQYNHFGFTIMNGTIFYHGSVPFKSQGFACYDIQNTDAKYISDSGMYGTTMFTPYLNSIVFFSIDSTRIQPAYHFWRLNGTETPSLLRNDVAPANEEIISFKGSLYYQGLDIDSNFNSELHKYTNTALDVTKNDNTILTTKLYPNPAEGNSTLEFSLNRPQIISVAITNIQGRIVYTIEKKQYHAGTQILVLPVKELSTGIYYYRINDAYNKLVASGKLVKN